METPLQRFRIVGRLEGISLLLLFFVAMPIKYMLGHPELVRIVGAAHGILFLAYLLCIYESAKAFNWSKFTTALALILSSVPGGTFYFEAKYLPKEMNG